MKCTVFIDESGDTGIKNIRDAAAGGSSPYFVLSASVMPRAPQIHAKRILEEVEKTIGKSWRHAADLNHLQKVYLAKRCTEVNQRFFAVVSRKETLGDYANDISWKPHKFYNKCTAYLLECVGHYLKGKGLFDSDPDVVFEGRNHDFDALRRFVGSIKENPLHERAKFIRCFNPFGFVERTKKEEPLLKFADLAANSVYSCVNTTPKNYFIPETRYLREIQTRFGANERGEVLDFGIKCIHDLKSLKLDAEVEMAWRSLKAKPRIAMGKT